jgi:hypothetical protein
VGAGGRLLAAGLRRAVYALLALPLGVWCLGLLLAGRTARAASLRLGALRRLAGTAAGSPSRGRWVVFSLVSLPVDAVVFAVAGYLWLLLPMNLLYPLRLAVYDESAVDSWGGPTMAGAWAFHAVVGTLVFLVAGLPLVAGLVWLQARVARRLLGPPVPEPVGSATSAAVA